MFTPKRILTLDVGAGKVALAEFATAKPGTPPELINYATSQLGIEPDSTDDPSPFIVTAVRELMRENGIKPAPLIASLSGQTVFPRYVKLPPVSGDKIRQIVQYEAEQNVPFPIEEVVWDFQLVGRTDEGDLNVMLVAAKNEHVAGLTQCVQAVDLEPEIVEVAPMALYNCVRFNYPELEGCTLVLDIGARSSNLIFIEEGRMFSRSIPIAGNAITQEIMKEFELSFEDAEALKLEHAFVAFGGVYAGPDNEVADRVSKITRNVVTRLHAEVNRSINFYRSQQGGSAPMLVLLAGGSSIIPHMDTFFREKLKVAVEYLNPFVNVPVNPVIDTERIEGELQLLGECVGMALRHSLTCPVEINLMPEELIAKKTLRRRQPFFVMAAVGVALVMLCWWVYAYRMSVTQGALVKEVEGRTQKLRGISVSFQGELDRQHEARDRVESLVGLVEARTRWIEVLRGVHGAVLDGMWLRSVTPVPNEDGTAIEEVDVAGKGFDDRLKTIEEETEGDATAVEVFRNKLREASQFSDSTDIRSEPPMKLGGYARDFTIRVALEEPIPIR